MITLSGSNKKGVVLTRPDQPQGGPIPPPPAIGFTVSTVTVGGNYPRQQPPNYPIPVPYANPINPGHPLDVPPSAPQLPGTMYPNLTPDSPPNTTTQEPPPPPYPGSVDQTPTRTGNRLPPISTSRVPNQGMLYGHGKNFTLPHVHNATGSGGPELPFDELPTPPK